MYRFFLLPRGHITAVLAALSLSSISLAASPSINVATKAAFSAPPYLLELLEAAAGENATAYFPLLDRIAEGAFAGATTDQQLYELFLTVLQEDGHISSPDALSTFQLSLALRSTAPRVEAHYHYFDTGVAPSILEAEGCADWLLLADQRVCLPDLEQALKSQTSELQYHVLPFDRILGSSARDAVLYADVTSADFSRFHPLLSEAARKGDLTYRLRYRIGHRDAADSLPVSGYGVSLQLKRTDYIVIDDRESEADSSSTHDTLPAGMVLGNDEEVADLKPLSSSEVTQLGLKAGSFIIHSDEPLDTLVKLTQDFPKFSASIVAHNFTADFIKEHRSNHLQAVPAGMNVLWMNGVQLIDRQIEPYTLIDSIRRERRLIRGVTDLGLTTTEAISLLGHREVTAGKSDDEPPRFDWRDDIEHGRVIVWLNDLEKDSRYAQYSSSLMALMQRAIPGQVPPVRRDIFNLVVPVDLSKLDDLLIVDQLLNFVKKGLTIRFGLAPLTPTKEAEDQAKLVYHLLENYGLGSMASYLEYCVAENKASRPEEALFERALSDKEPRAEATPLPFNDVLKSPYHAEQVTLAGHYTERLGADGSVPPVFINGLALPREEGWMRAMSMKLSYDLQMVQQSLFMGAIDEDIWVPGMFLDGASSHRNVYIFPDNENPLRVLDVNKIYSENANLFTRVPIIEASEDSSRDTWAALSVVADLTSEHGLQLLLHALQFRRDNPGVRLDIVNNPSTVIGAHAKNYAVKSQEDSLLNIETLGALEAAAFVEAGVEDDGFDAALAEFLQVAAIAPGSQALLLNGRVIGPIASGSPFKASDFLQLLAFEQSSRIIPVYRAADALGLSSKVSGPLAAAKLTSITALSTISDLPEGIFESVPTKRTTLYEDWDSAHTMFEVGDQSSAAIHFVALVNPTSEMGQRWAPILKVLSELDGIYMRVFVNPRDKMDELPIKRFYRYVLDSKPSFDGSGLVSSPGATFKGLPSEALLNLALDVPPAWLVAAKESIHDLDNLKLSSVKSDVDAIYELEHILIEGHSRDVTSGSAPRGVQLLLGTESDMHFADTIIMANLGYFQFKANPGYYNIQLKEGRSSEIFDITSIGSKGYGTVPGDEGTEVALMSFQGATLYPRLQRKDGMENADVLDEGDSEANDLLSKGIKFAEGLFGGSRSDMAKSVSVQDHAEINIFSVASGHLYERMLNIMMVSVMKNTQHTVKFWFIEQFLSPSFKEFIPHLAAAYGFKYEMVTYKWPHWLRGQKEKQREIWGYKILFLDVLFPLSLDKVIFVDADQIVRTDLIDLVNHDLQGSPYGFTPMCDSRVEMEGFRFWKQGYWANYLRGNPYHISALYVVDLRRFRELAAGDRLRQHYHQLSADPNSLSNLDQDLPNHMQFNIPIHSLPQEWLWCETWCSDESQAEARTIDLCNNPQTKEPKLDRARRQVPEWTVYDDEIASLVKAKKGDTAPVVESEDASTKPTGHDEL